MLHAVEDVFELVEIDERALELAEVHLAHLRDARDVAREPRHQRAAVGARLVEEPAIRAIARAIAQHHAAAGGERRADDLARFALAARFAGLRIDDLDEREVRVDVIAGGARVLGEGALDPCELRLGEAVGGDYVDALRAELSREFAQFVTDSSRRFLAAEHDHLELRHPEPIGDRGLEDVIDEGGHADNHLRLDLAHEAQISLGAHRLAAAGIEDEDAELLARVMREPEGEVRRVGKHIQQPHLAFDTAQAHHARAGEPQIVDVVRGVEEGDGLRGAARRAREEQWPELVLESLRDRRTPVQQRARDAGEAAREHGAVGLQHELARGLGMFGCREKVALHRKGDAAQIVGRAQRFRIEPAIRKDAPVARGEGQHGPAQIRAKAGELPATQRAEVGGPRVLEMARCHGKGRALSDRRAGPRRPCARGRCSASDA